MKLLSHHCCPSLQMGPITLMMMMLLIASLATIVQGLSSPLSNNRHVCLFNDYEAVRGPHFYALFDQLWEQTGYDDSNKRVAYITCGDSSLEEATKAHLQEDLDLEIHAVNIPIVDSPTISDPSQLETEILALDPSILWIGPHENAYVLRHAMRVLNLDFTVHNLCGPAEGRACLFVGEGSGALCAGSNMAAVALRGDDATACPELQFRGLQVLGPGRSVSFEKPMKCSPPLTMKEEVQLLQEKLATKPLYDPSEETTVLLNPEQVYVYSQQEGGDTTSLVMNPYQRGAIEQYASSSLPPAPPLSQLEGGSSVARDCTGEPSEDPSRTVYTTQVEEGDYW